MTVLLVKRTQSGLECSAVSCYNHQRKTMEIFRES